MMSFSKKIPLLMLVFSIVLLFATPTIFAAQNDIVGNENSEQSAQVTIIQNTDGCADDAGMITPQLTCTGPAGVARINWLETGRMISWDAKPNISVAYWFTGEITIANSNGQSVVIALNEFSGLGYGVSDTVPIYLTPGMYSATLSGAAVDIDGITSYVAPGCSISFYYH